MLSQEEKIWLEHTWEKVRNKLSVTALEVGAAFPAIGSDGRYVYEPDIYGWTNGFWPGMMWLLYLDTKKDAYRQIAEQCEEKLDEALDGFVMLHHDVGFMWLTSAVADYRITGNGASKTRGLKAASVLAGRFNPTGGFIRAWPSWSGNGENSGIAIIDSMMNIPLLYWASAEVADPRMKQIAMLHADTVMRDFVRPDGSCHHMVEYDAETGEIVAHPCGQGYESGSSWSRGQAWAVYGFTLSYIHTGKQEYLDTAKRVAHYFLANLGEPALPLVDFRAPSEPAIIDSTAGAIAACGLLELAGQVGELEKPLYYRAAIRILKALDAHCADYSEERQILMDRGTTAYHAEKGREIPIIYGEYYFMEALMKLRGSQILFW